MLFLKELLGKIECVLYGIWSKNGMWSKRNVLFLELTATGKWSFQNVLKMKCDLFRILSFWNVLKMECALFWMCSFLNVIKMEITLFRKCSYWNSFKLIEAKILDWFSMYWKAQPYHAKASVHIHIEYMRHIRCLFAVTVESLVRLAFYIMKDSVSRCMSWTWFGIWCQIFVHTHSLFTLGTLLIPGMLQSLKIREGTNDIGWA